METLCRGDDGTDSFVAKCIYFKNEIYYKTIL